MPRKIPRDVIRKALQDFEFKDLFVEGLGWNNPHGRTTATGITPIAQLSGVTVLEVKGGIPDQKARDDAHRAIEKTHYEHLLIFVDEERTQSLWSWRKRDGKKRIRREHAYFKGQPGDLFLTKLDGIFVDLDELRPDGTIPILEVTGKLAAAFDNERVTKKFYGAFSEVRLRFVEHIKGSIEQHPKDRDWYASVLLNRLMFVYFLQKRGFIQGNTAYLDDKLAQSRQRGADLFYSQFLQALFFEGFAKLEGERTEAAKKLIGELRYLNGGLFLRHDIEQRYDDIHIADAAFDEVLTLFGGYSWYLDDRTGASDNVINPDVLGYIFEKYINQKAFGAYYTRPQITEYLCERTIHAALLDKVEEYTGQRFESVGELLL
ncbi:MAG: ATP-binding protein, partial [Anaerolineae bacterium]|nr:ATP-binding protein [Anaerolineae bacterium]